MNAFPSDESPNDTQEPDSSPGIRHSAGEVVTDHAIDLYVKQEHESRRERFERQVLKASTTT